jgi:hypothetical protein
MKPDKSLPIFPLYNLYVEKEVENSYVCYPIIKMLGIIAFSLFLGLPLL